MNADDLRRRQKLIEMLSEWFEKEGYEVAPNASVYTGNDDAYNYDIPDKFDLISLAEAIMDFVDGDRS